MGKQQNKQAATPSLAAQAAVVVKAAVVQAAQRKPLGIKHTGHGAKLVALAAMQGTRTTVYAASSSYTRRPQIM